MADERNNPGGGASKVVDKNRAVKVKVAGKPAIVKASKVANKAVKKRLVAAKKVVNRPPAGKASQAVANRVVNRTANRAADS